MPVRTENFQYVQEIVQRYAAITLAERKEYLVECRLALLARKAGLESVDDLIDQLRSSASEALRQEVVDAMTTNETSFFRDQTPFNTLRDTVFDQLVSRRGRERTIRIWSAACASGQEAYSLAILWREFRKFSTGWTLKLLATDISHQMLERARAGCYSPMEIGRGLSKERRDANFTENGDRWKIDDGLRAMIEFRHLNLVQSWPSLPQMDVVFLRNVLVYFDQSTKEQILSRLRKILRPDGYLFLGGAESASMINSDFERVSTAGGSFYRLKRL